MQSRSADEEYCLEVGSLGPWVQSDKISHIDMEDNHIDVVISHIIRPYPISVSRMTVSIW